MDGRTAPASISVDNGPYIERFNGKFRDECLNDVYGVGMMLR